MDSEWALQDELRIRSHGKCGPGNYRRGSRQSDSIFTFSWRTGGCKTVVIFVSLDMSMQVKSSGLK